MSECIKVILVDDQKQWREFYPAHLNTLPGIKVVGAAADGGELFEMIKTTPYDIVLLDLEIRFGIDGVRTLEIAKEKNLDIKFIMMSGHNIKSITEHCLELGARGYVTKNTDLDLIREAIYQVHHNGFCKEITNSITDKHAGELEKELNSKYRLTERDIKVLIGLVHGKAIKVIASDIDVSDRSINRILKDIGKKTGAKSKGDMISFAVMSGIAWKL